MFMHKGHEFLEAPICSRSKATISMRPHCARAQGPCFQQGPTAPTRRGVGFQKARQKHPPQAILAGGGLVYSTGLLFGVFWCFLVFFGVFLVFFGCFLATCCAHLPPKRFFPWFVGGWGVGRLGGSGRHTIGWVDCFGFFWKFGCFLVFWTAQDAAAGPCLVSCLS